MTTITTQHMASPRQEGTQKQDIKRAKREARLMLKIEQAKQAVQKAERKVTKAQSILEDSSRRLHVREAAFTKAHDRRVGQGKQSDDAPLASDKEDAR